MFRTVLMMSVLLPAVPAQLPEFPAVGLALEKGLTVQRSGKPGVAVSAGELLFAGDVVRTGVNGVSILSCAQQAKVKLSPGAEADIAESGLVVKSGSIESRTPVSSCYLPSSPKLSLASQQHYGVLAARSGSIPPPIGTFDQRVDAVAEPKRSELKGALGRLEAALREDPRDAGSHISRGAVLEQSGLLYDAGESYRTAAALMPGTAWLRRKVIEIENRLLAQGSR